MRNTVLSAALAACLASIAHAEQHIITLTGTGGTSWLGIGSAVAGAFAISGIYDTSVTQSTYVYGPYSGYQTYTPITGVTFSSPAYTGSLMDDSYSYIPGSFGGQYTLFGFRWLAQNAISYWTPTSTSYATSDGRTVHVAITDVCPPSSCWPTPTLTLSLTPVVPESGTLALLTAGLLCVVVGVANRGRARKSGSV